MNNLLLIVKKYYFYWCNFVVQGGKKIIFTAYYFGKLKLTFTSPDVISTSPKNFLTSRIDFTVLLFEFLKKRHMPVGQVLTFKKTEFTSLIANSSSRRLLETTFFARCCFLIVKKF